MNIADRIQYLRKQKLWVTISLLAVYILCFALVAVRWVNIFNKNIYVINESVNSHITNFTLSVLLCTLIGYFLLLAGKKYRFTFIIGCLLIASNFIYEMFLPVLNTTDIVDAWYGLVGVVMSMVYLHFVGKYGLERE